MLAAVGNTVGHSPNQKPATPGKRRTALVERIIIGAPLGV